MIGQSKTRLLGVTVLVVMFAVGGLTGAVVQRTASADNTKTRPPESRGPSLFETLKLTEEQQSKICTIMAPYAQQMRTRDQAFQATWKEHERAMRALIADADTAMSAVLTPDQQAARDKFRAERKKFFAEREAKMKAQQQSKPGEAGPRRDGDRGGRSGGPGGKPRGPLGVSCPGLESGNGNGPHGGPSWGGDSTRGPRPDRNPADVKKPAPAAPGDPGTDPALTA